jgi:hypothetical protein
LSIFRTNDASSGHLKNNKMNRKYISFTNYLEYTKDLLIVMINKIKQVVFEILEILMFFRNNAPKISQMNALFLNKSNSFVIDKLI